MRRELSFPWAGMAIMALTVTGLVLGGVNLLVVTLVGLVWLVTLWFDWLRPPAPQEIVHVVERPDPEAVSRAALFAAIEPVGVPLLLTEDRRIVAANSAACEVLGAHVTGQDMRVALRHPDAVRLLEGPDSGSLTMRGLTGSRGLWQLTRTPVPGHAGFCLIELRDRTAEADLSRAHTDFVANASHELRTPLSSVIGYVETLAENPGGYDTQTIARFLATALREARRMDSLVGDLMSLSQLEAEKHDAPTGHVDVAALAARVVGEFSPHGRVAYDRPPDAMVVAGDIRQLEQLVRNLIDNALKYGDADQPVIVTLERSDGQQPQAVLAVRDCGPGIAPEHLPHLTRRFYRTDPGRSRAAGGTGLGLAIVKHIVERHRGQLDIASVLGEGTSVTVRLPLVAALAG
jgi:two-component system phosphate regulon sensor histidine kinase PhoR